MEKEWIGRGLWPCHSFSFWLQFSVNIMLRRGLHHRQTRTLNHMDRTQIDGIRWTGLQTTFGGRLDSKL